MITATFQDAANADPQKILAEIMALEKFGGVPVAILKVDEFPDNIEKIRNRPDGQKMFELFSLCIEELRACIEETAAGSLPSFSLSPAPPDWLYAHETSPQAYKPRDAGFVFLSPEDRPDFVLKSRFSLSCAKPVLTDASDAEWQLAIAFHELAHAVGAAETQADKILALSCRQVTPASPAPQIWADMRAISDILCAASLAEGAAPSPDEILQELNSDGWNCVEAIDAALALPQQAVSAMRHEDILDCRFERYENLLDSTLALGDIAKKAGVTDAKKSGSMTILAKSATKMANNIDSFTDCPRLHGMAHRFALGTRRLSKGESAYAPASKTGARTRLGVRTPS